MKRQLDNRIGKEGEGMENRILVTRSSMPPLEEYVAEIAPLWESHWLTNMGEKHKEFERLLKEYLGANNVALFVNGHNALECAIEALGLGADGRRKVITTPFTFASTAHAIVRKGLEPVFADVRADDYTIDPEQVARLAADPEVCAVLPVHVYGNLCDVDAIQSIADERGLKVLYDAAHAFGVERRRPDGSWESAASFGDASMFSFHATKVFNTVEGGAVCFRDPALKPVLDQWKNFGITGPEDVEYVGGNAKMNELCAAMGICNLRHLDEEIAKRRMVAARYCEQLEGVRGLHLSPLHEGVRSNFAYMPILFEGEAPAERDAAMAALAETGIGSRKYFYPLTSEFACYAGRFDSSMTPVALRLSRQVLCLPMYADLALEDVDRICRIVAGSRGRS